MDLTAKRATLDFYGRFLALGGCLRNDRRVAPATTGEAERPIYRGAVTPRKRSFWTRLVAWLRADRGSATRCSADWLAEHARRESGVGVDLPTWRKPGERNPEYDR